MLVTVLAFKSLKKSDEPKTIYLGHDRKEAFKMEVPEGYARTEVHLLAQPFKRKISSTYRKEQAANTSPEPAPEAKAPAKPKPEKPAPKGK